MQPVSISTHRLRIAVVASGKVAVVRRDDAVLGALFHIVAVPLADARTARIGQHLAAEQTSQLQRDARKAAVAGRLLGLQCLPMSR